MDAAAVQTAHRVVTAAGLLGAALAAPMALAVVTQIVTAIGAGAWFPPRRASAVDGHARRERRQPGVSNPAAATASRCSDRGCRDAQLVAARQGALTASGPAISGGPNGTDGVSHAPVDGRMSANARPTRESPIRRRCAGEHPSLYVD